MRGGGEEAVSQLMGVRGIKTDEVYCSTLKI
jgi:hypothetical protein